MDPHEWKLRKELVLWQRRMQRRPGLASELAAGLQRRINRAIPEKVHLALTAIIKQMVRGVLFGAEFTAPPPLTGVSLAVREQRIADRIDWYKTTAAAEGGVTGLGGFLSTMADFPLLIGIKVKMLFDVAALYGFDVKDFRERLYILHIFQLAFSSQRFRREVYGRMADWDTQARQLPQDIHAFDWRRFQQEYRDYIDLAKLAQMIPGIGAVVGTIVNYRLLEKLGTTAMNAYRMRLLAPLPA